MFTQYCRAKTKDSNCLFFKLLVTVFLFAEQNKYVMLKGLAQAKIIKKSVILFRVLSMTIWCKHAHRLELQIFLIFVMRIHQLG